MLCRSRSPVSKHPRRPRRCRPRPRARSRTPGEHQSALEGAAKQAGWTIERDGAVIAVRDVWTENEDHAAWLVATKVGLSPERVTVWAGRDA